MNNRILKIGAVFIGILLCGCQSNSQQRQMMVVDQDKAVFDSNKAYLLILVDSNGVNPNRLEYSFELIGTENVRIEVSGDTEYILVDDVNEGTHLIYELQTVSKVTNSVVKTENYWETFSTLNGFVTLYPKKIEISKLVPEYQRKGAYISFFDLSSKDERRCVEYAKKYFAIDDLFVITKRQG